MEPKAQMNHFYLIFGQNELWSNMVDHSLQPEIQYFLAIHAALFRGYGKNWSFGKVGVGN